MQTAKTAPKALLFLFINFLLLTASGRLRPHKLIEIGFQHAVIDLSVLIRLAPNAFFRILIGCDQVHRPGVQSGKPLSDFPVENRKILLLFNSLSLRRIGNNKAVFFGMA